MTDSLEEDKPAASGNDDGVYVYATEMLTLGLIWHGFHDSNKEGDGDRILRYWKFLLIIFKVPKRYNYAKISFCSTICCQTDRKHSCFGVDV